MFRLLKNILKSLIRQLLIPLSRVSNHILVVKNTTTLLDNLKQKKATADVMFVHTAKNFERVKPLTIDPEVHYKFKAGAPGITESSAPTYISSIEQARVLAPNGTVVSNNLQLLTDISVEIGKPVGSHSLLSSFLVKKPIIVREKAFLLTGPDASHNYFHWMTDAIPKLGILSEVGYTIEDFKHYIVNNFQYPFQQESLYYLGISEERIISLAKYPYLICDHLVATSPTCLSGNVSPWIMAYVRSAFAPLMKVSSSYGSKIYISRRNATKRRLINEEEVACFLESLGFTIVNLEELSLQEQIGTFFNAKEIIGIHGAGLTNLIFSNSDAKVIEIFPSTYVNQCFWTIASNLNLKYGYLLGKAELNQICNENSHLVDGNFTISIKDLDQLVKHF